MSAVLPTPVTASPLSAPIGGLLTGKMWGVLFAFVLIVSVAVPVMNLLIPAGSTFHLSDYAVSLIAKIFQDRAPLESAKSCDATATERQARLSVAAQ